MLVKVHNLNIHPYRENFRDREIMIPAGSFIEMDEDEADYFLQAFVFPKKDSQGRPDPLYFKKLKIERPPKVHVDEDEEDLICHANGQKYATRDELATVLKGFSHLLADKDPESETVVKKQNRDLKKENAELKSRLDLIEEKLGLKGVHPDEASI